MGQALWKDGAELQSPCLMMHVTEGCEALAQAVQRAVDATSLEVFKIRLNGALGN